MSLPRYFAPLRHRDFALLWSGQAVSQLGDGVFTVTLALEALRVDRSPAGLSYVLAARLVPALVFGLGDAVFFPASTAITPELVPAGELTGASASTRRARNWQGS